MQFKTWLRLNRSRRTETALLLGFIILITVIGISGSRSAAKLTQFIEAADEDRYYGLVVQDLQSVIADLTIAQNEQRGYLITGEPFFLVMYDNALKRVRGGFNGLLKLTLGDKRLYPQVIDLQQLTEKRLKFMSETIDLHRAGDEKRAREFVKRGRLLSAAIQQRLNQVRAEYGTALAETNTQVLALRTDTIRSFVVTLALAAIVLAFMGVTIIVEARFVRALSNQLLHESRYDSLTGLPNRAYLNESLARAISGAQRAGEKLGLLYMDLNGFKTINDTFGHNVGDQVLIEAARWFAATGRGADFIARLGGDEFAVVIPRVIGHNQVAAAAERFGKLAISRGDKVVSTSVGYAVFPDDGRSAEALTKHSDAAMYERKQARKSR